MENSCSFRDREFSLIWICRSVVHSFRHPTVSVPTVDGDSSASNMNNASILVHKFATMYFQTSNKPELYLHHLSFSRQINMPFNVNPFLTRDDPRDRKESRKW